MTGCRLRDEFGVGVVFLNVYDICMINDVLIHERFFFYQFIHLLIHSLTYLVKEIQRIL